MAGTRIMMSSLKQILLLRSLGTGKNKIASITGRSKTTINAYLDQIDRKGYVLQDLIQMEEPALEALFHHRDEVDEIHRFNALKDLFPCFSEELRRVGVNRMLLWEEYKEKNPGGYSYSQFCYHFQQWSEQNKCSLHIEQKPGDKVYIDFAGEKFPLVDRMTGEIREVEMLVATLGFSGLTYIEFCVSQQKEDFLHCVENALLFFGGVPQACVPDNLKSGVTKACRYEPGIARDLEDVANHYGMAIVPTRSRRPKDKAWVERMVNIIYSRVYARLRDQVFHDIHSLNQARLPLLEKHNGLKMQDRDHSRRELFESQERAVLKELPKERFEIKDYLKLTVGGNCHVYIKREQHYYSAPYRYIGKRCKIIFTARSVSIYFQGEQIAFHLRHTSPTRYTTNPEHLPKGHQMILAQSPEKLLQQGKQISPVVEQYLQQILNKPIYVEQAYKSCEGVLSFGRKASHERLIAACERGIQLNVFTYAFIKNIIHHKLDAVQEQAPVQYTLPFHENIRGAQHYK
jgi:transposase